MNTNRKSGIFGAIKNLVVEEDASEEATSNSETTTTGATVTQTFSSTSGQVDDAILKILGKEIDEVSQPAYSEFRTMYDSMALVITDQDTRVRAVLAALAAKGVTNQAIQTDLDECLVVLDEKERENAQASTDALKRRVGLKELRVAEIAERLTALDTEQKNLKAEKEKLAIEMAAERSDIEETRSRFVGTAASIRRHLQERKQTIAAKGS